MALLSILKLPARLTRNVLARVDSHKTEFLAVPANIRAAQDRLARVLLEINKGPTLPVVNATGARIGNELQRVRVEWDIAAERYTRLDALRRDGGTVTADGATLAGQLAVSAGYVVRNASKSRAAVDTFARQNLTAEQLARLDVASVGIAGGVSGVLAAAVVIGAVVAFRSRGR